MGKLHRIVITAVMAVLALCAGTSASAQRLNDKLQNRPYADNRKWHLGFSVGIHTQDITFKHNGFVTPDGQSWFMEQPSFSPGFCVNGLIDLRLNEYFNLRFSPGMYFGNRNIRMVDVNSDATEQQNLKSTFVVLPFDVKFSGQRYRNVKPFLTGGVMPVFDVAKKRSDFLQLKTTDVYLTVGLGCNFYLPFFNLNPEIKFCFGLADIINHKRPDLEDDPDRLKITQSIDRASSRMVVLTFYFE